VDSFLDSRQTLGGEDLVHRLDDTVPRFAIDCETGDVFYPTRNLYVGFYEQLSGTHGRLVEPVTNREIVKIIV